jgi:large subunit ribosomal protein L6
MSRIGRTPITVPSGVTLDISQNQIGVTGPKGKLKRSVPSGIQINLEGDQLKINRESDTGRHRALHGLTRSLVSNMVTGVSQGFVKELEIIGVGYRVNVLAPNKIELALGFSHPVLVDAPEGVTFEAPNPTRLLVKGIDKELVGQIAANIRSIRPPEPYKGKGVRYLNEKVLRKAGKAAK